MSEQNTLYPIFLKLRDLRVLIVGGGFVAEEKLQFMLKSSPDATITMVAQLYRPDTLEVARKGNVTMHTKSFDEGDLIGHHLVIAATDNLEVNTTVYRHCRALGILVNVADNPPLCDFYMGGIVTKGNVKIAISTNGKSPTAAKRLRQFFEEVLPEDLDDLVKNLNRLRKSLKDDFQHKVDYMNRLTRRMISD
jgi:precorrin-2 dehydrogenase/sirohydrochlorin ferrochelatase